MRFEAFGGAVTIPVESDGAGPAAARARRLLAVAAIALAPAAADASPAVQATGGAAAGQANGRRAVRVEVRGVPRRVRRNVRHHLSITGVPAGGAFEERLRRLHDRAPAEIRRALEPFGYYRPEIRSSLERRSDGRWVAIYRIEAGPAVTIDDIELRVAGPDSLASLLRRVAADAPLAPGAPLVHPEYESLKARLLRTARSRGYLDAAYDSSRVEVTVARSAARVILHLDAGPRYRYGRVRFSDTTALGSEFLLRFSPVEEGHTYSLAELVAFQSRLAGSGYFRTAEVDARRDSAVGLRVPVRVTVEPRPRTALSLGVGASTDRGPRASARWELRWLNRDGHRFAAEARAALFQQTAEVRYAAPVGTPGYEDLVFSAGFRREEFESVTLRTLRGTAGLLHQRGPWRETLQVQAEREWFDLGGEAGTATLVLPRVGWSRSSRDEALAPTRAARLSVDLQGTSTVLASDASFLQGQVTGSIIRSPYRGGRILLRAEIGVTAAATLDELPGSVRYFAGGDQSVRGYGYNTLAPVDSSGNLVGGRHLAVASAEFEQRLFGPFAAAAFVDAGTAARDLAGLAEPSVGAGAGARWRSPLGPVRLDLALALSRDGTPARLHLVVGPDP